MQPLNLNPRTTALILIDLQNGIMSLPLAPHNGTQVVQASASLAQSLRAAGGTIVFVRVEVSDVLHRPCDAPSRNPNAPPPPPEASQLVANCGFESEDLVITKRQWGAFYDTGLDQQLRRRGIKTILLGGVATNFGVESTARSAFDREYEIVFVEDAMSSLSPEAHAFAINSIFPRMGRVRTTHQVIADLEQALPTNGE
jgi:nicotinamidase-related amidase